MEGTSAPNPAPFCPVWENICCLSLWTSWGQGNQDITSLGMTQGENTQLGCQLYFCNSVLSCIHQRSVTVLLCDSVSPLILQKDTGHGVGELAGRTCGRGPLCSSWQAGYVAAEAASWWEPPKKPTWIKRTGNYSQLGIAETLEPPSFKEATPDTPLGLTPEWSAKARAASQREP